MTTTSDGATPTNVRDLYRIRFAGDQAFRDAMWKVLCADFFQRYVQPQDTVLEVAAGHCEFINNIRAARRIAVDINGDTRRAAAAGVEVFITSSTDLAPMADKSIDVVFVSNFFEHLERSQIMATLQECHRVLRVGGRMIILQPNIRYCYRDYWMFFDHITPLDDRALVEALQLAGFRIAEAVSRFLPFTSKSRFPRSIWLIRLYLRVPLAWKLLGGQALVIAER